MKQIQEIVQQIGQENQFSEVVLTDASGFPLAAFTQGSSPEPSAAIAAMIQRVAEQAGGRIGLGSMDEVSMYAESGQRLVCRRFMAGEHVLYLAVKLPAQMTYRRVTNQAIRQIRQAWSFR
ncbi:MAG: roadblock/LC7 domain-containing protein [Chloroflexota bacterium]